MRSNGGMDGKVCLVTGASSGIGLETAAVLAQMGATVVMTARDRARGEAAMADVRARSGSDRVGLLMVDFASVLSIRELATEFGAKYQRLDVLVNNAGVDLTVAVDEMPVEEWDRILRTNLRGPFLTSRQAFTVMKRSGGGQIVNIVSTAAKRAWANASAYHASKFGLLGLSYALHVEGRKHNVKVTALISGGMRTPFLLDRFPDIDVTTLQDPRNVAETVRFVLTQPAETVIPEVMVLPMRETSWP